MDTVTFTLQQLLALYNALPADVQPTVATGFLLAAYQLSTLQPYVPPEPA